MTLIPIVRRLPRYDDRVVHIGTFQIVDRQLDRTNEILRILHSQIDVTRFFLNIERCKCRAQNYCFVTFRSPMDAARYKYQVKVIQNVRWNGRTFNIHFSRPRRQAPVVQPVPVPRVQQQQIQDQPHVVEEEEEEHCTQQQQQK